jgi:hypothetical protein
MKNSRSWLTAFILLYLFAGTALAAAPWESPTSCARHIGLRSNGKLAVSFTMYSWYASALRELIADYRSLHGDPGLKLSFEQLQYGMGDFTVMRAADYAKDCASFGVVDPEVERLLELQKRRRLVADDLKGAAWIHFPTAIDTKEQGCLVYSKPRNARPQGCGDVWQGGLTADEVVCFEGKTYSKCHVECLTKLNDHTVELQPGFCQ